MFDLFGEEFDVAIQVFAVEGGSLLVQWGLDFDEPLGDQVLVALSRGGAALRYRTGGGRDVVDVYEDGQAAEVFDALLGGPPDDEFGGDGWSTPATVRWTVFAWAAVRVGVSPTRADLEQPALATLWPAT